MVTGPALLGLAVDGLLDVGTLIPALIVGFLMIAGVTIWADSRAAARTSRADHAAHLEQMLDTDSSRRLRVTATASGMRVTTTCSAAKGLSASSGSGGIPTGSTSSTTQSPCRGSPRTSTHASRPPKCAAPCTPWSRRARRCETACSSTPQRSEQGFSTYTTAVASRSSTDAAD